MASKVDQDGTYWMQVGLHTRLKPGTEERYEEYHRAVWPQVLEAIKRNGITRYFIFRDGLDLFHFIECEDYDRAIAEIAKDATSMRWEAEIATMMAVTHDFSGEGSDRMRKIWELCNGSSSARPRCRSPGFAWAPH